MLIIFLKFHEYFLNIILTKIIFLIFFFKLRSINENPHVQACSHQAVSHTTWAYIVELVDCSQTSEGTPNSRISCQT